MTDIRTEIQVVTSDFGSFLSPPNDAPAPDGFKPLTRWEFRSFRVAPDDSRHVDCHVVVWGRSVIPDVPFPGEETT